MYIVHRLSYSWGPRLGGEAMTRQQQRPPAAVWPCLHHPGPGENGEPRISDPVISGYLLSLLVGL